jgi:hypothetical protein
VTAIVATGVPAVLAVLTSVWWGWDHAVGAVMEASRLPTGAVILLVMTRSCRAQRAAGQVSETTATAVSPGTRVPSIMRTVSGPYRRRAGARAGNAQTVDDPVDRQSWPRTTARAATSSGWSGSSSPPAVPDCHPAGHGTQPAMADTPASPPTAVATAWSPGTASGTAEQP